jgi:F-type H+-transporting ATPase subunit a
VTQVGTGGVSSLAAGFVAPGPGDFKLPDILHGNQVLLTKASFLLLLGGLLAVGLLLGAIRKGAVVPGKLQFAGEQAYSFVRDGIARDTIGERDFRTYVPLLTSLFFFVLINNLFGIIPFLQFPSFSRAGFAYGLAGLVWLIYNFVGARRHGLLGYLKLQTVPADVPGWILPLLVPLEFLSNLIIRPITLSLRLFANMFAGHLLLLLFAGGADYLLIHATGPLVKPAGVFSFIMGVLVGFLEIVVEFLQAYVFTLLTASYIAGALADQH